MPRKLDPQIAKVLKDHGFGPESCWDCHGTWVIYHNVLEQIAAKADIRFDPPLPLETNGANKTVALCVTGRMGDKAEWSIGEASPANNKNAYPYAMAEKRGKDRAILKLIGLHGLAYSEEEADAFRSAPQPAPTDPDDVAAAAKRQTYIDACREIIKSEKNPEALANWWKDQRDDRIGYGLSQEEVDDLKNLVIARRDELKNAAVREMGGEALMAG